MAKSKNISILTRLQMTYIAVILQNKEIYALYSFFLLKKKTTSFLILAVCDAANFTPLDTVCKCISQN